METSEKIKTIKKLFFTYRNGIIADTLRNAGDPHSVIFGLNIPQLVNIAKEMGSDKDVACQLWHNSSSRESRMIAPMLFPHDRMDLNEANEWLNNVETVEIADNLCHKLLRYLPFASKVVEDNAISHNPLVRYAAFRLAMNLIILGKLENPQSVRALAHNEATKELILTQSLCLEISEELNQ